jgi:hypothetical protein
VAPEGTPVTWFQIPAMLADIQRTIHTLDANVRHLMSQQDEINQDVSDLQAAAAAAPLIAALENANPALDLSGPVAAFQSAI